MDMNACMYDIYLYYTIGKVPKNYNGSTVRYKTSETLYRILSNSGKNVQINFWGIVFLYRARLCIIVCRV